MKRETRLLNSEKFDILVIGGGINGCAIARDAALRGVKVALVEKDDFASGASGKTTKLIHGGIRYLEQLNFPLVREALHERFLLLKSIPHLVRPLEFIIPVYQGDPRSWLKIKCGTFLYDICAGKENIKPRQTLTREQLLSLAPKIKSQGLIAGVQYYDAQMDDIRICLDNAISAYAAGACIANKAEVIGFGKEKGRITQAKVQDKLNGQNFSVAADVFINATGAWSNQTIMQDDPQATRISRPTKGVHIVYGRKLSERAILLSAHKDKRVFFVIPWRDTSLIGTTDTDFSDSPDEVYSQKEDVDYLLNETARVFPNEKIDKDEVITTFAGLRPLINLVGKHSWKLSREHLIKVSGSGLISVVGGKYTTYRHLAEEVVDIALFRLEKRAFGECVTAKFGASLPEEIAPSLWQRVEKAVKEEMANTLVDLMVRRLQFSTAPGFGLESIEECAGIMSRLLDWREAQKEREIADYKNEMAKNRSACL